MATPIDVIKTRMQTAPEKYEGSITKAYQCIIEKGESGAIEVGVRFGCAIDLGVRFGLACFGCRGGYL